MTDDPISPDSRLGQRMLWLAALGLLGGFYLLFSMLDNEGGMVSSVDSNGAAMVVLEQDRNGHYEVEGKIDRKSVG